MEIRKIELFSANPGQESGEMSPDTIFGFGLKIIQWDDIDGKKSRAFLSFSDNGASWEALRGDMDDELIFAPGIDEEAWAGHARDILRGMIEENLREKGLSDDESSAIVEALIASNMEAISI